MGRHRMLGTAMALGILALAGCGGDGGSGGGGPNKADFLKRANAVCKKHNDRTSAAAAQLLAGGKLPTPQQFGRLAREKIVPEYAAAIGELRSLRPPGDLADGYRGWLADSQAVRAKMQKNPVIIQSPQTFAAVNREARALGLSSSCAVGPT